MAFRSPENVQRNELVRFQLESNIRAPANAAEQQKNGYNTGKFGPFTDFKKVNQIFVKCLHFLCKLRCL